MWLLAALACADPAPPSIVLVTLDTTRADRVGAYGYAQAHTPHLDRLAAEGVRFDAAYTTVPLTTPAHASMLTGLYPPSHGVRTNGDATLPEALTTLAEALEGHDSAASVGAFVTTRMWNLDQGFDAYFDAVGGAGQARWTLERPAESVVDDLVGWLESRSSRRPFLLWAHFYDAHHPHAAPEPWLASDPYDAELAYVDAQVGRLREAVDAAGGAAWIVAGDHGEAFGEHGERDHGMLLYDSTTRVPLIVRGARPGPGRVETEVVSVVDVFATALALAGQPAADVDGVDLTPALAAPLAERAPVVLESETPRQRFGWHPEVAAVDEGVKLMDTPSPRLYDLRADPDEQVNRLDELEDLAEPLRALIAEVRRRDAAVAEAPDASVAAQLEALGYVVGDAPVAALAVDVKDHLDVVHALEEARALAADPERVDEAEAAYRGALERAPELSEARLGLARLLERRGSFDEAQALLDEAVTADPEATTARLNRGFLLLRRGRPDLAEADARAVLGQVPEDRTARDLLLRTLALRGPAEPLAQVHAWRVPGVSDPFLDAMEGQLLLAMGRMSEGEAALRRSAAAPLPWAGVHRALAGLEDARGRGELALWHLEQEVALYPDDPRGRRALGDLKMSDQDWAGAAEAYAGLVARWPADGDARRAWAQAVLNTGDVASAAEILAPLLPSDDPQVLVLHANVLALGGDRAAAEAVFARARKAL